MASDWVSGYAVTRVVKRSIEQMALGLTTEGVA